MLDALGWQPCIDYGSDLVMVGHKSTYRPGFWGRLLSGARWSLTTDPATYDSIQLDFGRKHDELECTDVMSVETARAGLFHTVNVRLRKRTVSLAGLSFRAARQLSQNLRQFVGQHLATVLASDLGNLKQIDETLRAITDDHSRYLALSDFGAIASRFRESTAAALAHPLLDTALLLTRLQAALPSLALLGDRMGRLRYNDVFVAKELKRYQPFFDDLGGFALSSEQREACVRMEDNNLLIASAGSGKSATMVGKVAYLLEAGLYRPEEILVLAFNKSAADELKERIARQLKIDPSELACRVTTFHALGRSIIEEVEGRPPQLANWVENPAGEAEAIEDIVNQLVESDAAFQRLWVELLTVHPKADIPLKVFDSEADYRRYFADRSENGGGTVRTLAGIYVRSLQEQQIANWLWLRSVEFEYEKQVEVASEDGTARHVHPDFYYPKTNTFHEHLALNADGTSPFENYAANAVAKRAAYLSAGLDFFETMSAQAKDGALLEALEAELLQRGMEFTPRSLTEVLKAVEPVVLKHYQKLLALCVKHIRASHLTLDNLLERAKTLHDPVRARDFARVVWAVAAAYTRRLDEEKRIDFDSMIGDAIRLVDSEQYRSPFSLILVDEFQDISAPRANLIKALRNQKAASKVFAVGDDWQSIYRFAGSDISIFTQFETYFGSGWQGRLEQTYRCNQLIAQAAASFVQRNPDQLRKSVRSKRPAIAKSIRVISVDGKRGRPDFAEACTRVLARLDASLGSIASQWRTADGQKLKVLVLWRYNLLDPFKGKPPTFENIAVAGLSFHRSKGLEADYTVLLDVSEGDYGVPSRIEDDELVALVMPRPEKYPFAEERRLFYVALTRASRGVFLLANSDDPSRYIGELSEIAGDDVRFEALDGTPLQQCPKCRVGQLKERRGRHGRTFLGCSQFPECKHTQAMATGAA